MTIQLETKTEIDKAGKDPQFTAKFAGTWEGLEVALTIKAETERDVRSKIPLMFDKHFELKIIDPQKTLDEYQEVEAEIVEPGEQEADFDEVIEGPAAPERLMLEAGEEETEEEQTERLKKDVDGFVEENPEFRAVQKFCGPEIIEDLKKAEDEKHRKERRKRAKEVEQS